MPAADTVLLPICVGLALLGTIITVVAGRRGRRGRAVQGVGLALAPIALYISGLLRLLWNGVVAVGTWAGRVVLSPTVWFGLSLLGLCIVLWVVGGFIARRSPKRSKQPAKAKAGKTVNSTPGQPAVAARPAGAKAKTAAPVDDDMAEIEALLKSRGID